MGTTTQVSSTAFPQWTQDAYANTFDVGSGMLENFLRNPQYSVAGFTTDALKGMDLARATARNVYTAQPLSVTPNAANFTATLGQASQAPAVNPMMAASAAYTPGVTASQVTGSAINEQLNPYMGAVVDTTLQRMRRERDRMGAEIGARAAAAGSFGGSREAVQRSLLDRNYGDQVASTTAALMGAGYDKATATALANAQMRQVADIGNADRNQQTTLANAQFGQQANSANYQGDLQRALQNAQFRQQMGLANVAAGNQMKLAGADYDLKAAQVNDALRTTQQQREMSILNQLIGQGNVQQQQAQRAVDVPWTMLERLYNLTPKQLNQQTVTTKTEPDQGSGASSIMGGLSAGLGLIKGLAGLLPASDEREKTDIEKYGKPKDGEPQMYAYRYKGDPKTYPKVVGPMAQDMEKKYPGSTADVDGRKVVEPNLLIALMGKARKAA